ncbi:hypothetical protein IC614_09565 [Allosphingosinicella flava]|uniref:Uncharacterized protein n=1 Tax=Allosphingosinicella flava TaxID=2771430 RepID=A0A7T2GIX3_9SPHN|nr:hypothetical protein [Sphingosinicella flava]QPQ54572.1 hypothetical protein IC614_09565 [Sphingosinicella flava]
MRSFILSVALVASATPAAAHYVAVPVAKSAMKVPLGGVIWQCGDTGCTAGATTSRPETVCASFARKMGAVSAFAAGGRDFDAAALEKCNARAKS